MENNLILSGSNEIIYNKENEKNEIVGEDKENKIKNFKFKRVKGLCRR